MARDAAAWRWYAEMNDDVRHQLIDRSWFGQIQRDAAFEQDVTAMQAEADTLYGPPIETELDPEFDEGPEPWDDVYGADHRGEPDPADFYGAPDPAPDLYGPDRQPEPEP